MSNIQPQLSRANRISRRRFVQAGGGAMMGLSLPHLLWARRVAAGQALPAKARSVIFIIVSGGPSHIDTLDPKPAAPQEVRGPYKPIATRTPGVHVSEMLPRLASISDRYCIVRSLSHSEVPHVSAAHMLLTGQSDGSTSNNTPFIGSLVSKFRPPETSMPAHIWLHNMKTGTNKVPRYDSGLNVVGYSHAAMRVGYELDNAAAPDFRVKTFDPAEGVSPQRLSRRFGLLDQFQQRPAAPVLGEASDQFNTFQQKARELVSGTEARQAFDLNHESERTRDRYGRHPLGQYLLMSRRLVEAGVRLVTVTAWPGLAPGETQPTVTQVWDTHDIRYQAGDSMFGNGPFGLKWSLPRLDQGVSALLADLQQRGLLDETLVVMLGEFGRTPRFEGNGRGRGHWPHCFSALVAGGGVRGGAVYGSSDRQGAFVAAGRPLSFDDIGATLFYALGIPPETPYGPDGFSFRVSNGKPLLELFG